MKYTPQEIEEFYDHSLRKMSKTVDKLKSFITSKYEYDYKNASKKKRFEITKKYRKDIKACEDQMQNFEKLLEESFTHVEDSSSNCLDYPMANNAEEDATQNFTVLRNHSNDDLIDDFDVENNYKDSAYGENISGDQDMRNKNGSNQMKNEEFQFPRVKEEVEEQEEVLDGRGCSKEKCFICKRFFGRSTIGRHETSCWQKNGGNSSCLYFCKFENCEYFKQKTRYTRKLMRSHIQRKHHIPLEDAENYIMKMKNPNFLKRST